MTVTAAQLAELRDRGLTRTEAAEILGLNEHSFRSWVRTHGINWPRPCGHGHPTNDKIVVGDRTRCRLCYLAECASRKAVKSPFRPRSKFEARETKQVNSTKQAMRDALEASNALDRAIARETAPPWERHPVPWDNVAARAQ